MQHLTFRRATPADAPLVREITRAAYAKWVPVVGREPKPMTADYDHAVAHHIIELVEADGLPVALLEVIPTETYLLIENVAVLPTWHDKGLGSRLLQHADQIALSLGLNELRLYTNSLFATNVPFYARRGFGIFLREPHPAGGDVVHMLKSLAAD